MSIQPVAPTAATRQHDASPGHTRPAPLPEMPKPLTPATAAVHIMKVPSSRLLEAFVAITRAFERQGEAAPPTRQDAKRLEQAVAPKSPPTKLDLTA